MTMRFKQTSAFIIEEGNTVHEAFVYDQTLSDDSCKALEEYARANYGSDVVLRRMTPQEEVDFNVHGPAFLTGKQQTV